MEFRAESRFVRTSPQKVRLVLDLIKGRRVEEALNTLAFTKKGIAPNVHKLLRSAIENANYVGQEKGLDVDVDNLFVKRAIANDGPRMKRIRPAPMGRAFRYQRRMAHIEIVVSERDAQGVEVVYGEGGTAGGSTRTKSAGRAGAKAKKATKSKSAGKKAAAK